MDQEVRPQCGFGCFDARGVVWFREILKETASGYEVAGPSGSFELPALGGESPNNPIINYLYIKSLFIYKIIMFSGHCILNRRRERRIETYTTLLVAGNGILSSFSEVMFGAKYSKIIKSSPTLS